MKYIKIILLTLPLLSSGVFASTTMNKYSIKDALKSGYEQGLLSKDIKLVFGGSKKKGFAEITTSKKTNAVGKSGNKSCEWVFISALKNLQGQARKKRARSVINIKSNYNDIEFNSSTEFECAEGFIMSGVALKGTLSK